VAIPQAE